MRAVFAVPFGVGPGVLGGGTATGARRDLLETPHANGVAVFVAGIGVRVLVGEELAALGATGDALGAPSAFRARVAIHGGVFLGVGPLGGVVVVTDPVRGGALRGVPLQRLGGVAFVHVPHDSHLARASAHHGVFRAPPHRRCGGRARECGVHEAEGVRVVVLERVTHVVELGGIGVNAGRLGPLAAGAPRAGLEQLGFPRQHVPV